MSNIEQDVSQNVELKAGNVYKITRPDSFSYMFHFWGVPKEIVAVNEDGSYSFVFLRSGISWNSHVVMVEPNVAIQYSPNIPKRFTGAIVEIQNSFNENGRELCFIEDKNLFVLKELLETPISD